MALLSVKGADGCIPALPGVSITLLLLHTSARHRQACMAIAGDSSTLPRFVLMQSSRGRNAPATSTIWLRLDLSQIVNKSSI